jgi:hypothetical protein
MLLPQGFGRQGVPALPLLMVRRSASLSIRAAEEDDLSQHSNSPEMGMEIRVLVLERPDLSLYRLSFYHLVLGPSLVVE